MNNNKKCKTCGHEEERHLVRQFYAGENKPMKVVKLCRAWGCSCGNK